MAHGNFEILKLLLMQLDDNRNDIFVHIDRKSKSVPYDELKSVVAQAKLIFTKRITVDWGGDSQIKAELLLLEEATKTFHSYYHLLSGSDLLLWNQDKLHDFFKDNQGLEFLAFDELQDSTEIEKRVKLYHFLQNTIGRRKGKCIALVYKVEQLLLELQEKLRFDRMKAYEAEGIRYYKGANWFSITHEFAKYILNNIFMIEKMFYKSLCADELFMQTLIMNSQFKERISDKKLRLVDWDRGTPYTFTIDDYDLIVKSGMMIARKFDETVDLEVANRIVRKTQGRILSQT